MTIVIGGFSELIPANAQQPGNTTVANSIEGDYRGYSVTPFYFTGDALGNGAGPGFVSVGSKRNLLTGAQDSINIVLYQDDPLGGASPIVGSFNLGLIGATDLRPVSVVSLNDAWQSSGHSFSIAMQAKGGGKKDRIVTAVIFAETPATPTTASAWEIELPNQNVYVLSSDYFRGEALYLCGFATDPGVRGYPHQPTLADPKKAFLMRVYSNSYADYHLIDSPIPMNPPPPGVSWNGEYNDYDIA